MSVQNAHMNICISVDMTVAVLYLRLLNASLLLRLYKKAAVTSFLDNRSENEVWHRTYRHRAKSFHHPLLMVSRSL